LPLIDNIYFNIPLRLYLSEDGTLNEKNSNSFQRGFLDHITRPDQLKAGTVEIVKIQSKHSTKKGKRRNEPIVSPALWALNKEGYEVFNAGTDGDVMIYLPSETVTFDDEEPLPIRLDLGDVVSNEPIEAKIEAPENAAVDKGVEYREPADLFVNAKKKETFEIINFDEIIVQPKLEAAKVETKIAPEAKTIVVADIKSKEPPRAVPEAKVAVVEEIKAKEPMQAVPEAKVAVVADIKVKESSKVESRLGAKEGERVVLKLEPSKKMTPPDFLSRITRVQRNTMAGIRVKVNEVTSESNGNAEGVSTEKPFLSSKIETECAQTSSSTVEVKPTVSNILPVEESIEVDEPTTISSMVDAIEINDEVFDVMKLTVPSLEIEEGMIIGIL